MTMLRELDRDIWVADQPLRVFGLEIGARMTIVRLPNGGLFCHSPIACSRKLADELVPLGTPAFLVAPNRFHHLYAQEWLTTYPSSRLYVAPGLEKKRPDLAVTSVLGDHSLPEWSDVLDQAFLAGFPWSNEVVFFHKPSRTLITADLAFNVDATSPFLTRLAFRLSGAYGSLSSSIAERLLIRDRPAFRRSLERVLSWPIERIVVAHGKVLESGGQSALAKAYDWLRK